MENGSCDYPERLLYSFDIWSNIHYGYIGLAAGFTEWVLLSGAGFAQKLADTNPPGYWKRRLEEIGDADFLAAFDDPHDQQAIKIGFELWKGFKTKVTTKNILDSVRKYSSKLKTKQA
ncbi:polymorphic toxin type 44 domain-containing protein [Desulfonema magnum]|uniref:Bacterial toxin 44 domain-containing n=1 Tax=Desulfonema magnum TaxID=45655 RepID=A0A975BI56_9BACT|nr:polymorphic toxin type 44 domain-containing protein [Desulfonema magnum]QTA85832.1 Bacterial toxin 44 domain-containing [Desulfonema magnum]